MDPLQHDPRIKLQIKEAIFNFLYGPVKRQFQQRLDTIIITNTMLGKFTHKSFVYKGITYSCDTERPPLKRNPLVPQLRPLMEEYLKDEKEINEQELPIIVGFINQVLNSSNGLTDYLRLFPEAVHEPVKRLIAQYPYHNQELTEEQVESLRRKHEASIFMLKRRLAENLLLN